MDAVNFLKQWKRICKATDGKCNSATCPMYCNGTCLSGVPRFYLSEVPTIVEKVYKWSKTHPIKLTERQKIAIKGRIAEGARWIFVDGVTKGKVCFSDIKPTKKNNYVTSFDGRHPKYLGVCDDMLYKFVTWENSPIYLEKLLENKEE